MATSLADLLDRALRLAQRTPATAAAAEQAITALTPAGRALSVLTHDGIEERANDRRTMAVRELVRHCQHAASAWRPVPGRLSDLAGAAADTIGRLNGDLDSAERWHAAVAVTELVRQCAGAARRFPPYRNVPQLLHVHRVAALVEQLAAADPPSAQHGAALDRLIPATHLPDHQPAAQIAAEAAAALTAALHAAATGPGIRPTEALAAAAASHTAALHASAVEHALGARLERTAPDAWLAVQDALRPFRCSDIATPNGHSPVILWASRLQRALDDDRRGGHLDAGLALRAAATRTVTSQLPAIAAHLKVGLVRAAAHRLLLARARNLPHSEARTSAVIHDRIIPVTISDLTALTTALHRAEETSAALAAAHTGRTIEIETPTQSFAAELA